ncbi:MAG: helicase, partial [Ruminiclostridium sp.]|nr:helicase [Ruminiclostridium sp.]
MNQEKSEIQSEKLLIRDIVKEEAVLDILASADFKVKDGRVHLSGEDNIYEFVFQLVPRLQEHASVFYSSGLKNIKLKPSMTFSARFRLNNETDMLEFSFNADDIDRSELSEIIDSLVKKKKYFQLKNGSFLNLQSRELAQLDSLMNQMEIAAEDLQKEYLEIPKYRALYLDQSIRDAGIHNIERNHSFKEFVQNIKEPEDMEFKIPWNLKGALREYQKFGFKWLKTLDHYRLGGILADDMGLGKTIQIIALLLSAKNEGGRLPSLVVVPTSLVFNWCAELDKFA